MNKLASLVFLTLLAAVNGTAHAADTTSNAAHLLPVLSLGSPVPEFRIKEFNGKTFDSADEIGKIYIIHFWATWCPSCHEEMDALETFYQRYRQRDVGVIAIALDKPTDHDKVLDAMKRLAFNGALLSDMSKKSFRMPESLPATFIVGTDGIVAREITPAEHVLTVEILTEAVQSMQKLAAN